MWVVVTSYTDHQQQLITDHSYKKFYSLYFVNYSCSQKTVEQNFFCWNSFKCKLMLLVSGWVGVWVCGWVGVWVFEMHEDGHEISHNFVKLHVEAVAREGLCYKWLSYVTIVDVVVCGCIVWWLWWLICTNLKFIIYSYLLLCPTNSGWTTET